MMSFRPPPTTPRPEPTPSPRPPLTPADAREIFLAHEHTRRGRHNKFGVAPPAERTVDGILFDSKAEARRYRALLMLRGAGVVRFFLRQVPFHLPGKTRYVCDFQVHWADGRVTHEDVKGVRTEVYKLKRRQVEDLYPVTIEEVR